MDGKAEKEEVRKNLGPLAERDRDEKSESDYAEDYRALFVLHSKFVKRAR